MPDDGGMAYAPFRAAADARNGDRVARRPVRPAPPSSKTSVPPELRSRPQARCPVPAASIASASSRAWRSCSSWFSCVPHDRHR